MHKDIPTITSIVHQSRIELLCRPLEELEDIRYFVLYIIFNNGQKFVLSSTPKDFLIMYWHEKLEILDYSTQYDLFFDNSYYLCNEKLGTDMIFKNIIESK